jgi:hypothetical protein
VDETVAVVLTPEHGTRLFELCARFDVWAVDSALNRKAANSIWESLPPGDMSPITVFDWTPAETVSETILRILDTVEEHHPHCGRLQFVGAQQSPQVSTELQDRGFLYLVDTVDGFLASKDAA